MDEKEKRDLLKAEYLHLQATIEGFDNKALTIKAWSITFSFASYGVAFTNHTAILFIVAAIGSFIFWFLEASWKTFQYAFYERLEIIENFFRNETEGITPLQISKSWGESFRKGGTIRLFYIMLWQHVCLPHIIVVVIGLVLYLATGLGYIKI